MENKVFRSYTDLVRKPPRVSSDRYYNVLLYWYIYMDKSSYSPVARRELDYIRDVYKMGN